MRAHIAAWCAHCGQQIVWEKVGTSMAGGPVFQWCALEGRAVIDCPQSGGYHLPREEKA